MDSLSPYSRAISELFSTASASDNFYLESHTIRGTACFRHDDKSNSDERDTRSIDTLKRLTEIVVVVDLLSLHWFAFFLLCLL